MDLRKNILASYCSQFYVTLVGILILPLYLKYMGPEAYGLVAFFSTLQACFLLLDAGLTPTVARETARFGGGACSADAYHTLLSTLQTLFVVVAVSGSVLVFLCSGGIASRWLGARLLPLHEISICVQLMGGAAGLRWLAGLYRSIISGAEELAWLGGANALVASLRFIGPLPLLIWVSSSPLVFFVYQLFVGMVELLILLNKAHALIPCAPEYAEAGFSWASLKEILGFSASVAFTSSVWIVVTQADKIVLSKVLTLAEYGYFAMGVLAASGVLMISGPISAVLLPRMSHLEAKRDERGLIDIYHIATQGVAVIAVTATLILAFFPKEVLWVWTGNQEVAYRAASVLRLYALGNGLLALSAFPYYLQYAKGDLKLHVVGNALFVLFLIPALVWSSIHHGMVGAGYAWLISNLIYFFVWVPLVHSRFVGGLHWNWLAGDIAGPAVTGLLACTPIAMYTAWPVARGRVLLRLLGFGCGLLICCSAGSGWVRSSVARRLSLVDLPRRS